MKDGENAVLESLCFLAASNELFHCFFKAFGGHIHMSYFGATGTPVLDFFWRLLWVSKPKFVLPYSQMQCIFPKIHLWCYTC